MRPNRNTMMMGVLIAALSAILILSNLAGCSRSTKPREVKYNLYVGATHLAANAEDSSYNRIYIYDADSLTLRDSIWQAHFTEFLDVSPDGRWLYVTGFKTQWTPREVAKIDIRTKQTVWSPSDLWGVRCIAYGTLLLAGRDVLKAEDGTFVRHLADSLYPFWGPASGTKIAAIGHIADSANGNPPVVRVIDVSTGEVSGAFVPRLTSGIGLHALYTVRLHPDGRRVLAIGLYGSVYNSWFVVGDVITGQTLFEYPIDFPHGEIAISNDGNTAIFTDPGAAAFEGTGTPHAVDLRSYRVVKPTNPREDPNSPYIHGSQVRFLPGDGRIVVAPMATIWHAGPVQVVDRATMTLEKRFWTIPSDSVAGEFVGGIAVGPRP